MSCAPPCKDESRKNLPFAQSLGTLIHWISGNDIILVVEGEVKYLRVPTCLMIKLLPKQAVKEKKRKKKSSPMKSRRRTNREGQTRKSAPRKIPVIGKLRGNLWHNHYVSNLQILHHLSPRTTQEAAQKRAVCSNPHNAVFVSVRGPAYVPT